jgi:hypothetical protein
MIRVQEYEMGGTLNKHRRERRTLKILVGKPEERKPLGRPRHRCEDNIRIYLREIG